MPHTVQCPFIPAEDDALSFSFTVGINGSRGL